MILIHVFISAWLVVEFEGQYTEGQPSPTKIKALVAVDNEETLIDVEMENSTSFILYSLFRDYSEPEIESNSSSTQTSNDTTNNTNNNENDDKSDDSSSSEDIEWLKTGRKTVVVVMVLLVISEILVLIGMPFRATLRALLWLSVIASFTVVIPGTYILDLVGDDDGDDNDDKDKTDSLADETFVKSTESGSMAHEENDVDSSLMPLGIKFEMMFSGYDLGLVEPENYSQVREEPPSENSTDAKSFVKFESVLELKYGKNLPSLLLIPVMWFFLPAKPKTNDKQYMFESE